MFVGWGMSGDWIKMRTDLSVDPAVIKMARDFKKNRDEIVGILHRTWAWADGATADGTVLGVTLDDLNEIIGIKRWAQAMQDVGWLEVVDGSIRFPRFDKHNGQSAKRRATDADRKANKRDEESKNRPQPVRDLSASQADRMRTREEEEEEKSLSSTSSKNTRAIVSDPVGMVCDTIERGFVSAKGEHLAGAGEMYQARERLTRLLADPWREGTCADFAPELADLLASQRFASVRAAVNFVESVCRRCRRDDCLPGDPMKGGKGLTIQREQEPEVSDVWSKVQ